MGQYTVYCNGSQNLKNLSGGVGELRIDNLGADKADWGWLFFDKSPVPSGEVLDSASVLAVYCHAPYPLSLILGQIAGPSWNGPEWKITSGGVKGAVPEACIDAFVDTVYDQRVGSNESLKKLKLVYTPLHGTGLECVKKLLKKLNITQVSIVPEQEYPDENFTTCPYPNPEIPEAMQKGLELCERVRPDILLGTDPDCDRCGAAVPDGEGRYRLLTGNEIGIILLDYICRVRMANGTMPKRPVAVTTIVSTDMAVSIAERYEVELRRTLTGFKFIGEQIGALEKAGEEDRFIFGFEESYGYLSGSHV